MDAAGRVAALAGAAAAPAELIDALAEALLELPAVGEVHARRWPDAMRSSLAVVYRPGTPARSRAYVAASWESEALSRAIGARRPVTEARADALPPQLAQRSSAVTLVPLGLDDEPWGVVAVSTRPFASAGDARLARTAMVTLAAIAGLGLRGGRRREGEDRRQHARRAGGARSRAPARALLMRLAEEVARAARSSAAPGPLLVVEIEELAGNGLAPAVRGRLVASVEQSLREEVGDPDRVSRLGEGRFVVLLPSGGAEPAGAAARRLIHRLDAVSSWSAVTRQPLRIAVAVSHWQEPESAEAFLLRAASLIDRPKPDIGRARDALAAGTPNLPS